MAKERRYRYLVTGSLAFPIDMLRYDQAWPVSEGLDSSQITASIRHETTGPVTVELRSTQPPTRGRWESFGWRVSEVGEYWLP